MSIEQSGLYNRDHNIYLEFEDNLKRISEHEKSYIFCLACEERSRNSRVFKGKPEISYIENLLKRREMYASKHQRHNISKHISCMTLIPTRTVYYALIDDITKDEFIELEQDCSYTAGLLDFKRLSERVSTELLEDIIYFSTEDFSIDIYNIIKPHRYNTVQPFHAGGEVSKKAYIEIDLTKSLDDIIEVLTNVKTQFDNDPSIVESPFEAIGQTLVPFTCTIKDCDIFKHKSPKSLEGKMADLLFIYDCKQIGLTEEYITNEITRYWKDVKKISTEKFFSIDEYYKQAKKYIEEKKYHSYLTGIDNYPSENIYI